MPSAAEIQSYLAANPGMSDADIAAAMNQYGVSTADMAAATGSNLADIQARYDAVMPAAPAAEPIADPYQPAYEAPSPYVAPAAPSPFVSAFTPSNFIEPPDEPVAPAAAPAIGGLASLAPQAPTAPVAEPQGILSGISGTAPTAQPDGILSGIVKPDINNVNVPPAAPVKPTDQEIVKFFTDNPNTSDADIAQIMNNTGLKPEDIARATGTKVEDVTSRYEAATTPQDGIAALSGGKTSPVTEATKPPALPPVEPVVPSAPEVKYGTDQYTKSQVTDYIGNVMNDATLAPWEKTNKIMESAQKAGISQDNLKEIYGKDVVDPYLKDYGAGIKTYITNTLADPKKSDFEKLASINQAAEKYGLDTKEIAGYSGMNEKGVQKVFDSFDSGLKSIVTNLSAPTVSDIDKTKGALALQSKYGITDDQIAKALGGGVTGKDVKAYLDPVKEFAPKFQELTSDNTKTAADIKSFIDQAKKDPRIEGLYGLAIQNAEKMLPVLGLRDSMSGNGTPEQLAKGYTDFVAAVNADPALKEKYGAQADAIDKVAKMSQRIADEQYGGKLQPHMFETFLGLDQKTMADVPKTLEMTPGETKTVTDNEGNTQTYTTPGTLKDAKGYEPVYNITGSGENETRELAGYTKPVKTAAGVTVDAQYDAQGNLTGYRGRPEDKVWPQHRVGITGVWDASGKAMPEQKVETPGFAKSVLQDVSALGPIGQLAIMAATGGLGSLAAGALQSSLGPMLAKAVGSGLVSGAMSEIGGGNFGKGFLKGSIGNPVEALTQNLMGNVMPNIDTGNATLNEYVGKALPSLASSTVGALIDKKDLGDAALGSLLNTGTNMATSSLINSAMPDTLTPEAQKMFTGVSGQLLSNLLRGQTPDVQKAVMGTIMQNAMSSGKDTATKTATEKGKTMGEGDLDFDWSMFSGNESPSGVDLSSLEDMGLTGVGDLPELNFDQTDLSGLGDIDLSQLGEMGLTGVDGLDLSSLMQGQGDFDQAAPPANIAELLSSVDTTSPEALSKIDWNALANEGLTPEEIAKREELMKYGSERNQDFGGADVTKYLDEFNENFNPAGGYGSQWQTVGTNRVMVRDDGTANVLNPTTGESSYLTKEQTDALVKNGTLNSKDSGYVAATGGSGYVQGGGKTIVNADGTKSIIKPDGKVFIQDKNGSITDTNKVVNVNDPKLATDPAAVVKNAVTPPGTPPPKTPTTPTTTTKPAGDKSNMLMMLLALMAMMNKGGGSSTGSGGTIPSLQANRTQLPYGPVSGGVAARPGAGGVNYFSPTTYTQKAAGGGMMYGGGGISDLGGYSDGGRLLKGPGDGVSDSIPATIGGKQPARLATGEFVVPARIVSELGNGSTDAGAQKLYAMMDRVQKARRKTKNVAADTKAHKYLPA